MPSHSKRAPVPSPHPAWPSTDDLLLDEPNPAPDHSSNTVTLGKKRAKNAAARQSVPSPSPERAAAAEEEIWPVRHQIPRAFPRRDLAAEAEHGASLRAPETMSETVVSEKVSDECTPPQEACDSPTPYGSTRSPPVSPRQAKARPVSFGGRPASQYATRASPSPYPYPPTTTYGSPPALPPHMPQQHFYQPQDVDLGLGTASAAAQARNPTLIKASTLSQPGAQDRKLVLLGSYAQLDVLAYCEQSLELVGSLRKLPGSVLDAVFLTWNEGADGLGHLRPLVAITLCLHHDAHDSPLAPRPASAYRPDSGQSFTLAVAVYSLKQQCLVADLLTLPDQLAEEPLSYAHVSFATQPRLQAHGNFLALAFPLSGELKSRDFDLPPADASRGGQLRAQPIFSLNGRWLAYCPAAPDVQALGVLLDGSIATYGTSATSSTGPTARPSVTCSVDSPDTPTLLGRAAKGAAQGILRGAEIARERGVQLWREYWNADGQSNPALASRPPPSMAAGRRPVDGFPPTHADAPSVENTEPEGDVQYVWDLFQMKYLRAAILPQDHEVGQLAPKVRQIAKYERMSPSVIVDLEWDTLTGNKFAVLTQNRTIHLALASSTQPMLASLRNRAPSASGAEAGAAATSGLGYASATGLRGSKAVAVGLSKSLGAANDAVAQMRHAGQSRIHLSWNALPGRMAWRCKDDKTALTLLDSSGVRSYTIRKTNPRERQANTVSVFSGDRPVGIRFPADAPSAMGSPGLWKLQAGTKRVSEALAAPLGQAEIETSAPYQPFHSDRRITMSVFAQGPGQGKGRFTASAILSPPTSDQAAVDGDRWVFGADIPTARLSLGHVQKDDYDPATSTIYRETTSVPVGGHDTEQIFSTTTKRRARRPMHAPTPGRGSARDDAEDYEDSVLEDDSVLDLAMRKQVRTVILFMSLMEAIRVGPLQLVFAGKQGYPAPGEDDYGIAYTMGYIVSWIYMCLFSIVFVPLFSWWLPTPVPGSRSEKSLNAVGCFLKKFNLILLPLTVGLCLTHYIYYTIHTFIYVDSRPRGSCALPKNSKKNWLTRLLLLMGVAFSISFGYYALQVLDEMELARVKSIEYYTIVLPVQVNIGVLIGSAFQYKIEKRMQRKEALKAAAPATTLEEGNLNEKTALLD
ncbi:hypothetical protein DV737_g1125, partial [Chaetothyriales sp. CBS 132003]